MEKKQFKLLKKRFSTDNKSHTIGAALRVSVSLLVYWLILFLDK